MKINIMEITQSVVFLLFLFLVLLEAEISRGQKKDDCQILDKLDYCKNNSRIMITKTRDFYFVRLCHFNSQCMSDVTGDMNLRIRCRDVCDTCKALPGQNGMAGSNIPHLILPVSLIFPHSSACSLSCFSPSLWT